MIEARVRLVTYERRTRTVRARGRSTTDVVADAYGRAGEAPGTWEGDGEAGDTWVDAIEREGGPALPVPWEMADRTASEVATVHLPEGVRASGLKIGSGIVRVVETFHWGTLARLARASAPGEPPVLEVTLTREHGPQARLVGPGPVIVERAGGAGPDAHRVLGDASRVSERTALVEIGWEEGGSYVIEVRRGDVRVEITDARGPDRGRAMDKRG